MSDTEVLSRLLSGKKNTRLVLRRNADGLTTGALVRSVGALWRVQGRITRTGDVVLEAADPPEALHDPAPRAVRR
jgi:hypothetical protein